MCLEEFQRYKSSFFFRLSFLLVIIAMNDNSAVAEAATAMLSQNFLLHTYTKKLIRETTFIVQNLGYICDIISKFLTRSFRLISFSLLKYIQTVLLIFYLKGILKHYNVTIFAKHVF